MLMILPAIPYIEGTSPTTVYRFENESVQFKGTNAILSFGSGKYVASWNIFKIDQTVNEAQPMSSTGSINKVEIMNIGNLSQTQIINKYQNSAVLKGDNGSLNVAEIYNFDSSGDSINSNIVLNNANNTPEVYSPVFSILTTNGSVVLSGFVKPKIINETNNIGDTVSFGNNFSSIQMGDLYISWLPDTSIFVSGIVHFTQTSDVLSLFFNPIDINPMGSFSIDPIIRPMMFTTPPHGSGGGSPPPVKHYPPSISSVSVPDPAVLKYGTVCIQGSISPMDVSATITYRVFEYVTSIGEGAWVNLSSSCIIYPGTYSYSFKVSTYSADEVDIVAQNSYGTTVSNPVDISVLLQLSHVSVYDENGNYLAAYMISALKTTNGWSSPCIVYTTQVFEPSSCCSYGSTLYPHALYAFNWSMANDNSLDNTGQGSGHYGVTWNHIETYIAGSSNTLPEVESVILDIEIYALHILDLGVTPDYNTFGNNWNFNSKYLITENNISYNVPGNSRCVGGNIKNYDHLPLTVSYPTTAGSEALMFATVDDGLSSHGESPNYVEYDVTLEFIDQSYPAGYNTITCSSSGIVACINVPPP